MKGMTCVVRGDRVVYTEEEHRGVAPTRMHVCTFAEVATMADVLREHLQRCMPPRLPLDASRALADALADASHEIVRLRGVIGEYTKRTDWRPGR